MSDRLLRRSLAVTLTLLPLSLAVACGDDDTKVVYITADTGTGTRPPSNNPDGATFCEPMEVPLQSFNAVPIKQGVCTAAQIRSLLDSCSFAGSAAACETARSQGGNCASCMIGAASDPALHPLYQFNPASGAVVNQGACMFAVSKTEEDRNCATAFGKLETCSFAACITPCLDDETAEATEHFQSCLIAAQNYCPAGLDVVDTEACKARYADATYGFCTSGKNENGVDLTNLEYFTRIASLICGDGTANLDAGVDSSGDSGKTD